MKSLICLIKNFIFMGLIDIFCNKPLIQSEKSHNIFSYPLYPMTDFRHRRTNGNLRGYLAIATGISAGITIRGYRYRNHHCRIRCGKRKVRSPAAARDCLIDISRTAANRAGNTSALDY